MGRSSANVILATANVFIRNFVKARALLDPGAMSNFMTREFAQSLGLKMLDVNTDVEGVNSSANSVFKQINATVLANSKRYKTCENFLIVYRVTSNLRLLQGVYLRSASSRWKNQSVKNTSLKHISAMIIECLPFKDNIERVGSTEEIATEIFLNLKK
nr:unnamed protein product [Callosobruchus analis]